MVYNGHDDHDEYVDHPDSEYDDPSRGVPMVEDFETRLRVLIDGNMNNPRFQSYREFVRDYSPRGST